MGRFTNFLGSGKPITASTVQTLTFTGNDLPSAGVVAFHIVTQSANTSGATATPMSAISRIRVKADNRLIFDVSGDHFRKWQERFSSVGYAFKTDGNRLTIPFNLFDIVDDDLADVCQFPRGTVPTVELTTTTSATTGFVYAGWTQTDAQPVFYPTLLGQALGISSNVVNATFPINERGAMRGVVLDTLGLRRAKLTLNGFDYHQVTGSAYSNAQYGITGDLSVETQALEDGSGNSGSAVITSQVGLRVPMVLANTGTSRIELDTSNATGMVWAGVGNEITTWAVHNQN